MLQFVKRGDEDSATGVVCVVAGAEDVADYYSADFDVLYFM